MAGRMCRAERDEMIDGEDRYPNESIDRLTKNLRLIVLWCCGAAVSCSRGDDDGDQYGKCSVSNLYCAVMRRGEWYKRDCQCERYTPNEAKMHGHRYDMGAVRSHSPTV
jgi:hypothetical protein